MIKHSIISIAIILFIAGCSSLEQYKTNNNYIFNEEVNNIKIDNPNFDSFSIKDSNFYGISDFTFNNSDFNILTSNFFNNTYISTNNNLTISDISTNWDSSFNINFSQNFIKNSFFNLTNSYVNDLRVLGLLDGYDDFNISDSSFNKLTLELENNNYPVDINLNNNTAIDFYSTLSGEYYDVNISEFSSDSLSLQLAIANSFNLENYSSVKKSNINLGLNDVNNVYLNSITNNEFLFLKANSTKKVDLFNIDNESSSILINGTDTVIDLNNIKSTEKFNFESYAFEGSSMNIKSFKTPITYFKSNFSNSYFENIDVNKFTYELTGEYSKVDNVNLFISKSNIDTPVVFINSLKNAKINLDSINKENDSNNKTKFVIKTAKTKNLDITIKDSDIAVFYIETDNELNNVNFDINKLDKGLSLYINEDFFNNKKLKISKQLCLFNDGKFKVFNAMDKKELSLNSICENK